MKTLTRLGWCAAVIAWFAACDSGGSSTDGNTSWLTLCDASTVCAAGMKCSCGVCTKSCDSQGACEDLGSGAACVTPALVGSACSTAPEPSGPVCMRLCVSSTECSAGLSCIAGFCAPHSSTDAGSGGAGPGDEADASGTGSGGDSTGNGGGGAGAIEGSGGESAGAPAGGGATADGGATRDGGGDPADSSASGGNGAIEGGSGPSHDATTGGATSLDAGSPDATSAGMGVDAGRAIVTSVAAGQYHACALVNGGVQCWGRNDAKQLGNATAGDYSTVPVPVTGLGCNASALCAGMHHTCALVNGRVLCWGSNDLGQLGTDTVTGATAEPVAVPQLSEIEAIACGRDHTCALRAGGVACWGDNSFNQLGVTGGPIEGPQQVLDHQTGVTAIFANGRNTCAIVNGGLRCWGDDTWGQLGNGVSGVSAFVPYQPPELAAGVTSVSIGDGELICASVNGKVLCSGRTFYDIDSQSWSEQHTFTPVSAPFDSGFQGLSSGNEFTCGILNGAAYCFGVGTVAHFTAGPNIVGLSSGVESIATGDYFACALKDGAVWCWGWDMDGQLGRGVVGAGGYPQPVTGLVATQSCPYSHCLDHELNGGETAVDCGGECRACALGQACAVDGDCQSNACDSASRQCVSFHCNDHHQDGDETDSDCGGPSCDQCTAGKACSYHSDCVTGFCGNHVCN